MHGYIKKLGSFVGHMIAIGDEDGGGMRGRWGRAAAFGASAVVSFLAWQASCRAKLRTRERACGGWGGGGIGLTGGGEQRTVQSESTAATCPGASCGLAVIKGMRFTNWKGAYSGSASTALSFASCS